MKKGTYFPKSYLPLPVFCRVVKIQIYYVPQSLLKYTNSLCLLLTHSKKGKNGIDGSLDLGDISQVESTDNCRLGTRAAGTNTKVGINPNQDIRLSVRKYSGIV